MGILKIDTMHRRTPSRPNTLIVASLCVSIGVLIVAVRASAQWTEPTVPIPSAITTETIVDTVPLNTSGIPQTKRGPLTVGKGVTVVGNLNITGNLCWGGVDPDDDALCRSTWEAVNIGKLVRLQTSDRLVEDSGFVNVKNPFFTIQYPFTVRGDAAAPDPFTGAIERTGVVGKAAEFGDGYSYGVVGSAGSQDIADRYGVYATDGGERDAFAARFNGNVAFVGLPGESDLFVGKMLDSDGLQLQTVSDARADKVSEVCLNGECKSRWDTIGNSFWSYTWNQNSNPIDSSYALWPSRWYRGLSVGDGKFTITLSPQSMIPGVPPTSAAMTTVGNMAAQKVVIGKPTPLTIGNSTCGDRICNDPTETAGTCPDDCDTVAPLPVSSASKVAGPDSSGYIILKWTTAKASGDLNGAGGTRILTTDGLRPVGPNDGTPIDVNDTPPDEYTRTFGPYGHGRVYFWFYAYDKDNAGRPLNFSSEPFALVVDI